MTGTKRCDRCWELEGRIQSDPLLAALILESIPHRKEGPPEDEFLRWWYINEYRWIGKGVFNPIARAAWGAWQAATDTHQKQDARRYRWLRDGEKGPGFITSKEDRGKLVSDSDVDLDRVVDCFIAIADERKKP